MRRVEGGVMNTLSHRVLGTSIAAALVALAACSTSSDDAQQLGDAGPPQGDAGDAGTLALSEPKLAGTPLNTIMTSKVLPQLDFLFNKLSVEKKDFTLDGTKAFGGGDTFLPGKIAIGFSYLLLQTPQSDPKFAEYLKRYQDIADLTVDDTNKTWGIYYYMSAINKLKNAGLLDQAVTGTTLDKLKSSLVWRPFVNQTDYSLINLPTNYYGVAFSIARLREILGWDTTTDSQRLMDKMIEHYQTYSGEYGFSDETDGQGRFDRYSVLFIGEICQRLIETNMDVSAQLKSWLRKSVDVILMRLNPAGNGFDYGRSLGPYADTAFVEVLTAAEHLDVLTPAEKPVAYAFVTRVAAKYVEFWQDDTMQSVNLWDNGRRADGYRGKSRILGENLSLPHQLLYTNNIWNGDAYKDKAPMPTSDFVAYLDKLPRTSLTWFARGDYDRALVTYRDGLRIISLPLVNGGTTYHRLNPYFAVPYSYNMLSSAADSDYPHLQPKFTLGDGKQLIPAAFIKTVTTEESGTTLTVRYTQTEMDNVAAADPIKDTRIALATEYKFEPGQITRTDKYSPSPAGSVPLSAIAMEFASYSDHVTIDGKHFTYATGDVTSFEVSGLDTCTVKEVGTDPVYQTPTGSLQSSVVCATGPTTLEQPLTIQWVLKYRSPGVPSIVPK